MSFCLGFDVMLNFSGTKIHIVLLKKSTNLKRMTFCLGVDVDNVKLL